MSSCQICQGLIMEPNVSYGYAGKVCQCNAPMYPAQPERIMTSEQASREAFEKWCDEMESNPFPVKVTPFRAWQAALSSDEVRGWRTMDSAPKDGRYVLCVNLKEAQKIESMRYESGYWYWFEGDCPRDEYQPTHWMPLPLLPIAATPTGGE